jgi:hypothetical protein
MNRVDRKNSPARLLGMAEYWKTLKWEFVQGLQLPCHGWALYAELSSPDFLLGTMNHWSILTGEWYDQICVLKTLLLSKWGERDGGKEDQGPTEVITESQWATSEAQPRLWQWKQLKTTESYIRGSLVVVWNQPVKHGWFSGLGIGWVTCSRGMAAREDIVYFLGNFWSREVSINPKLCWLISQHFIRVDMSSLRA